MFEMNYMFTGSTTPVAILELLAINGVFCSTVDIIEVEEVLKDNANDLRFYVNNKLVKTLEAIDSLEAFVNSWSFLRNINLTINSKK
jgi:hypothetical protein